MCTQTVGQAPATNPNATDDLFYQNHVKRIGSESAAIKGPCVGSSRSLQGAHVSLKCLHLTVMVPVDDAQRV